MSSYLYCRVVVASLLISRLCFVVNYKESVPVFVNVYRAQESIRPAFVAWRACITIGLSYRPARAGN